MGTRLAFLGPPIPQVSGEKFLSRNEATHSLLGHLGKDSFLTFRGFKPPMVCPLVGKKEAGCTAKNSPCFLRKVSKGSPIHGSLDKANVDGGTPW